MTSKSMLVISPDLVALDEYAKKESAKFKPADVFRLGGALQVKETTEFMQQAYLSPVGDGKIMIICDVSTMTPQAQNKMLKTLEEAPARTMFLLLGTNADTILNTVRSRCMTKFLRPTNTGSRTLINGDILKILKDIFNVEIDEKLLSIEQRQGILDCIAKINRNVNANCNTVNHQDLLIMEILKYAKNS